MTTGTRQQTRQNVRLHDDRLRILSIFLTVDGECNEWGPGTWSVFIRTAGCDVGCEWCDTKYSWSWKQGKDMTIDEIFQQARIMYGAEALEQYLEPKITITGGEPLQQWHNGMYNLINRFLQNGWNISIETSGCLKIPEVLFYTYNVNLVLDYKLESSQVEMRPVESNFDGRLDEHHHVKFVIQNIEDFYEAVDKVQEIRRKGCRAQVYFSPAFGRLADSQLFRWLKNNVRARGLGVKLNIQAHKYIFREGWREEEK